MFGVSAKEGNVGAVVRRDPDWASVRKSRQGLEGQVTGVLKLEGMDDVELPGGYQGGKPRLWIGWRDVGQNTGPNRAIADVEDQPGCRPKCNVSEFFMQVMVRL